ncbi:MAG: helix-turn-helix domain-containing protein [Desulfobulbaceae bacterium]|uniref:Helix-turn-helix domain-containing protein n=1 Tax=Candidatus Desulfobia pelagia TaxID=2841692 RepID=A0A8J6NBR9_9BACT|nr:helix-turn-helix domain-containing protein [Candidatus Desulfobia pelagia]
MQSDSFPSGRIPMVKIDGARIRQLRESQGLTQLFLATSVEVTTDTISRWENKRYPTIKRENAVRLAEALEVELDAILDHSDEETANDENEIPDHDQHESHPETPSRLTPVKKPPFTLIVATIIAILLAGILAWWFFPAPQEISVSARRFLPAHSAAGQPFPVAIEVKTGSIDPQTLILKESLPQGAVLLSLVPPNSAVDHHNSLKWLSKVKETQIFAYIVKVEKSSAAPVVFSGTVAVHKAPGEQLRVEGRDSIVIDEYHWADNNGDGIISDEEILTVYDEFSEISGLEIDIDQVEEIWLGSGYRWDASQGIFVVLP